MGCTYAHIHENCQTLKAQGAWADRGAWDSMQLVIIDPIKGSGKKLNQKATKEEGATGE